MLGDSAFDFEKWRKDADYASVVAQVRPEKGAGSEYPPKHPFDLYFWIRAHLILGQYSAGKTLLAQFRSRLSSLGLDVLLDAQIDAHEMDHLDEISARLIELRPRLPSDPYLQGEYHFTLGLLCFQQGLAQQSIAYQQLAALDYERAGLPLQHAVALFNQGLSAHHLRKDELFFQSLRDLQRVGQKNPGTTAELAFLKLRSHQLVHLEEYEGAIDHLKRAIALSERLGRLRDAESSLSFLIFSYLKTDRLGELTLVFEKLRSEQNDYYNRRIAEMEKISKLGMIRGAAARTLLKDWKKHVKDPVTLVLLLDLLIERCLRSHEYETVLQLVSYGHRLVIESEQSLSLIDWRSYEVEALAAMGQMDRASKVLERFERDALVLKSAVRLKRADGLRHLLRLGRESGPDRVELTLDLDRHRLEWSVGRLDLSSKPTVERFIEILARHGELDTGALAERVYGLKAFDPNLHQARIQSLVDRVRSLLPSSEWIARRDGKVGFGGGVSCQIHDVRRNGHAGELRRGQILRFLSKSAGAVSVSQLEAGLQEARRTLQADLGFLLKEGKISRIGKKRSAKYHLIGSVK